MSISSLLNMFSSKSLNRIILELVIITAIVCFLHVYLLVPHLTQKETLRQPLSDVIMLSPENSVMSNNSAALTHHVPNLVHFIWIYPEKNEFHFHQMISVLAALKCMQPNGMIFWFTNRPIGKWWRFVLQVAPNMALWELEPATHIYQHDITIPEHQSDLARIDILLKYGGIYLDLDVIILKSLSDFYHHDVTMGAEDPVHLGSGLIVAKPNAVFLRKWRETYRFYNKSLWNYNSVIQPMLIAKEQPHLVHINWFGLHRPNWHEREWLYKPGKLWDWSRNYAIHLWYRTHHTEYDPENIRCLNTTTGEVLRHHYYGNYNLIPPC